MSQKSSACRWLAGFVHFGLSSRAATFALVVVWSGAFAAHASAEKLVIAEGAHVIGYLAVYIAKDEGYFTQEWLDVDIVPTRGSAQAVAAIIGGGADVALATVSDVANAVSEGRNLKVIAGITNQPQMMLTVSTEFAKKHNITAQSPLDQRLKALKGGTFAVSAPGSMTDDVMKALLTMGGFSPDRDAQIMALRGAGSEMLGARTKPAIEQRIRRQHLPLEVRGDEEPTDDKARDDVAGDDLKVGEGAAELRAGVRRERKRGNADQRQRARFRGDDRQADDDP